MLPYILMICALGLAFVLIDSSQRSSLPAICLVLLVVFVGLRYEIGVDWLAYERLFAFVPDNFSLNDYSVSGTALQTEFLFYGLIVFVKSLGLPFEGLLFLMAAFNLLVIDRMCRKISPNSQPFVWLVYFCLAIGTVQFNIVRQALASSFVIISLLYAAQHRPVASLVFLGLGFGFHSSVLMFLPVIGLVRFEPRKSIIVGFLLICAFLFISGVFVGATLLNIVAAILPGVIGSKAENYASAFDAGTLFGISPLAMLLIVAYLYLIQFFVKAKQDMYTKIAVYLTLLVLFAHLALGAYPSFWNRVMCVSLPWQLATLWRLKYFEQFGRLQQTPIRIVVTVVLGSAMVFQLSRPESKPFVPYHSLLQVWLVGDKGDGRQRAIETIREAELQNQ